MHSAETGHGLCSTRLHILFVTTSICKRYKNFIQIEIFDILSKCGKYLNIIMNYFKHNQFFLGDKKQQGDS